jgi:hypothetical protein
MSSTRLYVGKHNTQEASLVNRLVSRDQVTARAYIKAAFANKQMTGL